MRLPLITLLSGCAVALASTSTLHTPIIAPEGITAGASTFSGVVTGISLPRVWNAQEYGWTPDSTDRTSAATNLLQIVYAAGGGTIYFPPAAGNYRADGQLVIPNDGASPKPLQADILLLGAASGPNWHNAFLHSPSTLDLRYEGANGGKIETRGRGTLQLKNLTVSDGGSSANTTPLVHVTNTEFIANNCTFSGAGGTTQDAIVLGGGVAEANNGVDGAFQGYGTSIKNCHFTRLNRGVYLRTWANSVVVSDNVWQGNTGTIALEIDGTVASANGDFGNIITGNLFQMDTGYIYGMMLKGAKNNYIAGNSFWDSGSSVLSYFCVTNNSFGNTIIAGHHPTTKPDLSGSSVSMQYTTLIGGVQSKVASALHGLAASEFASGLIVKGKSWTSSSNYPGAFAVVDIDNANNNVSIGYESTSNVGMIQAAKTTTKEPLALNPLGGMVGVNVLLPTSTLQVAGSVAASMAFGGAKTLGATNYFYGVTSDGVTVTLPTAVGIPGRAYEIKIFSPATTATVATTSSQLIDGASSYGLSASNKFLIVRSDNTNWWIIGSN